MEEVIQQSAHTPWWLLAVLGAYVIGAGATLIILPKSIEKEMKRIAWFRERHRERKALMQKYDDDFRRGR